MENKFVTPTIKYIGVADTTLDLFESQYSVPDGISYNSYVISDDKVAVFDTVDRRKSKEWFSNLDAALSDRQPDYLIVSHLEPDHAYNIKTFMEKYPEVIVVATSKAFDMMLQFFDNDFCERRLVVKECSTLCLGSHTLQFYMAPMVHWPEVMVSYEISEKVLFSADAFGTFGTAAKIGDDWVDEARRYYINICGKYGVPVQSLLKKASMLDIRTICPLHGPVLKENLGFYIDKYLTWSSYNLEDEGVLVAYASIHGNTGAAAMRMAELLREGGAKSVEVRDLSRCDMSEAVAMAFRYGCMVVAASSYDAGVFPPMHDFLQHLKTKAYQNRKVAVIENGSWAPSAAKVMCAMFGEMKNVTVCQPVVTIRSVMKLSDEQQMQQQVASLLD